jgi:hypothetical protein
VLALDLSTIVHIRLAQPSLEASSSAVAFVSIEQIDAFRSIRTWIRLATIVNIDRTSRAGIAGLALAVEAVDQVYTFGTKHARTRLAFVNIDLAVFASKTVWTLAFIRVDPVQACRVVATRLRQALVDVDLTIGARISGHTVASKVDE